MFEKLQASQGKKIVLELVNGRIISGTVLLVNQQYVRLETDEGTGTVPIKTVQIIWEPSTRSLTKENMDELAEKLRDTAKQKLICPTSFSCPQVYTCAPPFACLSAFTCPTGSVNLPPTPCPVAFTCTPPFRIPPIGCGIEHLCPVNITGMFPPTPGMPPGGCAAPVVPTPPPFGCPMGITGMFPPTPGMPPGGCASPVAPTPPPFGCPMGITGMFPPTPGMPTGGFASPVVGQSTEDSLKAHISCVSFPGFTCTFNYICRPPDSCTFSFACPGSYVPGFPSAGGGCPLFFCGTFQFGLPCGVFQFQQPCSFFFGQPCGTFQFGQPCTFRFQCGPFQFGGSQCGALGGFICPGLQFAGVLAMPFTTSTTADIPPMPPTELAVKKDDQNKEDKEKKE